MAKKTANQLWAAIDEVIPKTRRDLGSMETFALRDRFLTDYSFAIPSREAISTIAAFVGGDTVLEVCAGSGLLAALLAAEGVDIIATDAGTWSKKLGDDNLLSVNIGRYHQVFTADAVDAVKDYKADVLMLCWPPYDKPIAYNALGIFQGSKVVYIGEGDGGCTADDAFHGMLDFAWTPAPGSPHDIPQWPGIHDDLYLYTRKKA